MWLDWLVFCDYGFSVSALWCPLATPTVLLGFLLPWTWGISSRLLQQSAAAAPYLGWRMSGEALQIAEKRRDTKGKEEKERYIYLNSKFQGIAKRDKKIFLSDQCKEIEGNNRRGKTRDLFKKIRDKKENISYKDGHNKGQKEYGPSRSRRY